MICPEKWQKQIEDLMKQYGIAGLAVAVTDREKTVWHHGFGVTSVEKPWDPVTTETLFRIASCTKLTVGLLTMQMVEQGRLDLDVPVSTYVPWFKLADRSTEERITLRRLLSHSAGLPSEYTPDGPHDEDKLEEVLREGFSGLRPIADPADKLYYYCNWGVRLVSWILQDITGLPFTALVKKNVLQPLGMSHSTFTLCEAATYSLAVPHKPGPEVLHFIPVNATRHAAGGMFSTVDDLTALARVLLNDGAPLVKPESLRQMMTPECSLYLNYRNDYGITMRLKQYKDILICGHDGQSPPYYASVWTVPEKGVGITLLLNTQGGNPLSTDIIPKMILDDILELPKEWDVWKTGLADPEAETLSEGQYLSDPYGLFRLERRNGVLTLILGANEYPLTPHIRKGVYFADKGGEPIVVGLPAANGGSAGHVFIDSILCQKVMPQPEPSEDELKQYTGEYGTVLERFEFKTEGGKLWIRRRGHGDFRECRYVGPDTFSCDFGAVRFVRKYGEITLVRVGSSAGHNKT